MILVACGVAAEARAAASGEVRAVAGGGDADRLATELARLAPTADAVLSWGLAGALRDDLRVGDWVIGSSVVGGADHACDLAWQGRAAALLSGAVVGRVHADGRLADPAAKRRLAAGGAVAVDMESHVAARIAAAHGLPFAILRVVSDRAGDAVPPAAVAAMAPGGRTDIARLLGALARRPGELPAFVAFARHGLAALAALRAGRARLGPRLGGPLTAPERGGRRG